MRTFIVLIALVQSIFLSAQAPTISGDQFLCINTQGTAHVEGDIEYDSYQWYKKLSYEEEAEYEIIPGATSDSLSYNFEYNEYFIKVVVTLDGETYESNELYLESPWMVGILMEVSFDDPNYYVNEDGNNICEGYSMRLEILAPWNHSVQWLKDGQIIEGATEPVFYATETGYYGALCAHEICPLDFSYSLGASLTVHQCEEMGTSDDLPQKPSIYPNPTIDFIHFQNFEAFDVKSIAIFDAQGKMVKQDTITPDVKRISVQELPKGIYFLRLIGENQTFHLKFTKK